jgi:hypothetical protein
VGFELLLQAIDTATVILVGIAKHLQFRLQGGPATMPTSPALTPAAPADKHRLRAPAGPEPSTTPSVRLRISLLPLSGSQTRGEEWLFIELARQAAVIRAERLSMMDLKGYLIAFSSVDGL